MVVAQMAINFLYQYWIHTEVITKMPSWYEAVFNTPSHHRVHHATNPQYLDRNHAGIFIIWDKLFGTYEPEVEKPVYGLVKNIDTYNLLKVEFAEWINMLRDALLTPTSWKNRISYLFMPPGWRHDDGGKISRDLRQEWEEKQVHQS